MISRWLLPLALFVTLNDAVVRNVECMTDRELFDELKYAQDARRVLLKLRGTTRDKLIAEHLKTITQDFLGEKPRESHKGSIEAVEDLSVLLADDAVPTIRKALEASGRLGDAGNAFGGKAAASLLRIGLAGQRDEAERLAWAFRRALALPQEDREFDALRDYIDVASNRDGHRLLDVVARVVHDKSTRFDTTRLIDLVKNVYWSDFQKGSLVELYSKTLVLLTDKVDGARQFGIDFNAHFLDMAALPSTDVYENRSWLDWSLNLITANAQKRADVEKDLPWIRDHWPSVTDGLRSAIRKALDYTRERMTSESQKAGQVDLRLKEGALSPEERASLQKERAVHTANLEHFRKMTEQFQAALR